LQARKAKSSTKRFLEQRGDEGLSCILNVGKKKMERGARTNEKKKNKNSWMNQERDYSLNGGLGISFPALSSLKKGKERMTLMRKKARLSGRRFPSGLQFPEPLRERTETPNHGREKKKNHHFDMIYTTKEKSGRRLGNFSRWFWREY